MKVFLKVLEKLKKQPMCNNPAESDLICKYNKGWNDAIEKVEELISSYNVSDMWIPVDVKLPPEPKPNHTFKGDIYLIASKKEQFLSEQCGMANIFQTVSKS